MAKAINIIIDDSTYNPPWTVFVEIELDNGRSVAVGQRIPYKEAKPLTKIRITPQDILELEELTL